MKKLIICLILLIISVICFSQEFIPAKDFSGIEIGYPCYVACAETGKTTIKYNSGFDQQANVINTVSLGCFGIYYTQGWEHQDLGINIAGFPLILETNISRLELQPVCVRYHSGYWKSIEASPILFYEWTSTNCFDGSRNYIGWTSYTYQIREAALRDGYKYNSFGVGANICLFRLLSASFYYCEKSIGFSLGVKILDIGQIFKYY